MAGKNVLTVRVSAELQDGLKPSEATADNHYTVETPVRRRKRTCVVVPAAVSPLSPCALLVGGALGRRQDLETFVRDRLSALDREAVGSGGKALLGSLDSGKLFAQIVFQAFVELVLVEIGCEICRVELVGRLAVVLARAPADRTRDPRALSRQ